MVTTLYPTTRSQMNAFCNADDISWGTKNLDTKRSDHEAAKMKSKALAYQGARAALTRLLVACLRWRPSESFISSGS